MHRRFVWLAALVAAALGLTGCGSELGTVSPKLVELYDVAAPDGVIQIEIDRDGTVQSMEAGVPISSLPQAVKKVALAKAPGARITGAEREFRPDGDAWEVKLFHEGRNWEFVIGEDGTVLKTEKEIQRVEAPRAVLNAARPAVPGGIFRSVEEVKRHDGSTVYHVKYMIAGVSYKVVLTPEGGVERKVREHRSEIEIPLK